MDSEGGCEIHSRMEHFMVSSWVRVGVLQDRTLQGEFMGKDEVPPGMEHFMVGSWVRVRCIPEWNTSW